MFLTIIIDTRAAYNFVYNSCLNARPFCDKEELHFDTVDIIKSQLTAMFTEVNGGSIDGYTQAIHNNIYKLSCIGVPEEQACLICNRCESILIECVYSTVPQLDDINRMQVINFTMISATDLIIKVKVHDKKILAMHQATQQ